MEKTLFAFIWKHSKRDQIILLILTVMLFPVLYLTLELPKRIINDAIGAESDTVLVLGSEMDQTAFLVVLCFAFLIAVIVHGLTKMRINTFKGVLAERMLRRFRYDLISRILRFPQPYLRNTSQGELVSMITSESEPLGGMMGDAVSQPVMQAGQMLTILAFLFVQNVLLGLAAIALIPVQGWLIPKLQREINVYNKKRIQQVRRLAGEIGENAAGAATLRVHGGWRYRQAIIADRLGKLFGIRLIIYRKKFFMKFLNNFITQLTPFFFFLFGGFLVIQGNMTLGALVAALAAYKDLSSPWKELLTYYNQVQELSQRWQLIIERFAPDGMLDHKLFEGCPEDIPRISGDVVFENVSVQDSDGNLILDKLDAKIPSGATVLINASEEDDRHALADLLVREALPTTGRISIGNVSLSDMHQATISARIGRAEASPYVFDGTFGGNVLMPLNTGPDKVAETRQRDDPKRTLEASRSGNSLDRVDVPWLQPDLATFSEEGEIFDWWVALLDSTEARQRVLRRALDLTFDPCKHPEFSDALVQLRHATDERNEAQASNPVFFELQQEKFNPALSIAENLFFAKHHGRFSSSDGAAAGFLQLLRASGQESGLLRLSQEVVEMLHQIFGDDGTDHPLFRMLGLDAKSFDSKVHLVKKSRSVSVKKMKDNELAEILSLLFEISAEKIGPAFTAELEAQVMDMRRSWLENDKNKLSEAFDTIDYTTCARGLSILENVLFAKISNVAGGRLEAERDKILAYLTEADLTRELVRILFDVPSGMAGSNLSGSLAAPMAITRAAIKKPDLLVLDGALGNLEANAQEPFLQRLKVLLPDVTLISIEENHEESEIFDLVLSLDEGGLSQSGPDAMLRTENAATADLNRKMTALKSAELFKGLSAKQLRLLAFGAKWYSAKAGQYVFRQGDDGSDGAYLLIDGEARVYARGNNDEETLIATYTDGALVGELALIRKLPRALDMKAHTDLEALRIGEREFLAVVENDAKTAFKILQTIAKYVGVAAQQKSS